MFIRNIFVAFLFLNFNFNVNSQNTTRILNQNLGKCNCDLILNACDLNCCCDTSCSSDDLKSFRCTTTSSSSTNLQWCVASTALFLQNTPYIVNSFGDLVCVDLNNSLSMNYYQAPLLDSVVLKEEYIKQLVDLIYPLTPQQSIFSVQLPESKDSFDNTDYVWQIFSSNSLTYLTLPVQIGSKCRDGPPVYYLKDKTSKCLIQSDDIRNECKGTKSTLSLNYFLNNFKFVQKPKSLKTCFNASTQSPQTFDYFTSCDGKYLTNINVRSCSFEDGTQISAEECSTNYLKPTLDNTKTGCNNLVKNIRFIFRYKNPNGIVEAGIDVVFFNYASYETSDKSVEQTFQVFFIPESIALSSFDSTFTQKLSGNPGYIKGQPIQAGSTANIQDRNKRFTYLMPDSQGNCPTDDSKRAPVNFGQNVFTECVYKPVINPNLENYCSLLQTQIDNIILGFVLDNRANRFAPFGNSATNSWKTIINNSPSSQVSVSNVNGVCKALRIGATIQIAYALLGNTRDPQVEIEYISYNWNEVVDINLRCSGQFCININNLKIKVSTRVTFVDVSQPPLYTESKIARPQTNLPADFFYPLTSTSSKIIPKYFYLVQLFPLFIFRF